LRLVASQTEKFIGDDPDNVSTRNRSTAPCNCFDALAQNKDLENNFKHVLDQYRDEQVDVLSEKVLKQSKTKNIDFLEKLQIICKSNQRVREATDERGNLLFFDLGHWELNKNVERGTSTWNELKAGDS